MNFAAESRLFFTGSFSRRSKSSTRPADDLTSRNQDFTCYHELFERSRPHLNAPTVSVEDFEWAPDFYDRDVACKELASGLFGHDLRRTIDPRCNCRTSS